MKYTDFEAIMSPERMSRYLIATNGDTNKAMALYRANLHLSQEVFTTKQNRSPRANMFHALIADG